MPAWIFYGNEVWTFDNYEEGNMPLLDENNQYSPQNNIGHSYLCINAIDGSIIDLAQGY